MTVRQFGLWRVASACLVLAASTVMGLWAPRALEVSAGWTWIALMLLATSSLAVLMQAWHLKPMSLRWDTQRWFWGVAATAGQEPHVGQLAVALDLGGWMLLRLKPEGANVLHSGTWLPVQRRGHEAAWHALRCTVYCARPVSLPTAAPF